MNIFEYSEQKKRDEALSIVASHSPDWIELAMIEMRELSRDPAIERDYPNGWNFQNVRRWLVPLLGHPAHANSWGALAMKCVKAGLIHDTGAFSRTGAHARKQTVYLWRKS